MLGSHGQNNCHHNEPSQVHSGQSGVVRRTGTVKYFNSSEGYGFFKVHGSQDVYFRGTDLRSFHMTDQPKSGETFNFEVREKLWHGNTVKYRAYNIRKVLQDQGVYRNNQSSSSWANRQYVDGKINSAHPHLQNKDAKGSSGNTSYMKSYQKEMNTSKKTGFTNNAIKIGNPIRVPVRNLTVVSATGPCSAEMAPDPVYESSRKLREEISHKKALYNSLNLKKLPDGGRRLIEQINKLEYQLKNVRIANGSGSVVTESSLHQLKKAAAVSQTVGDGEPAVKSSTCSSFAPYESVPNHIRPTSSGAHVQSKAKEIRPPLQLPEKEFGAKFVDFAHMPTGPLFGGRMTNSRISEVRLVTKAAIEDMHKSLKSCPDATIEETDPAGLKVDLMTHQRQALAWLLWREKQTVSGGILADDMGLGKTLTMIALILKQREKEGTNVEKVEDRIEDFGNPADSLDDTEDEKEASPAPSIGEENDQLEKSESTLIVAPASLVFHWEKEIRNRCHKGLLSIHVYHGTSREKDPSRLSEFDVVVTTYDIVRRCSINPTDKRESTLLHINWRRVILDEAHKIKNVKSQSSEAVCKITAKSRWAMSGTPVQNDITDMYAILKFLDYRPFSEYKLWKNQVDNKTSQGRERLKTLTSCVLLRREKAGLTKEGAPLVSLPPRKTFDHTITLTKVEREVYDKLKEQSKASYKEFQDTVKGKGKQSSGNAATEEPGVRKPVTATALLVLLLRMRQCCGHLSLLKGSFDQELLEKEKSELALEDMFQSMALHDTAGPELSLDVELDKSKCFKTESVSAKIEFVLKELNTLRVESPTDKSVVISQWTSMLNIVAFHLKKCGINFEMITGAQTAKKRMDIVDQFNTNPVKPMVILLSLQAGGVGLNLIGGNHLYILDMHWNPALESQACDRIYRVGQKKPVFIHRFIVEDSVEENIRKLQTHKLLLAKAVMDGASSKESQKLSLRDMKLLFGL